MSRGRERLLLSELSLSFVARGMLTHLVNRVPVCALGSREVVFLWLRALGTTLSRSHDLVNRVTFQRRARGPVTDGGGSLASAVGACVQAEGGS
jgi:hypothetical protein